MRNLKSEWAATLLVLLACGDSAASGGSTGSGCPEGVICGTGADGVGASGATGPGGAGGNTGAAGPGPGGTGGSGGCTEAWECSPWQSEPEGSNNGVRTCVDANNCGTTNNKPVETANLPALDVDFYQCEIEPIMNRTCSMLGCHGTDSRGLRTYSRGRFRNVTESVANPCPGGGMTPLSNCIGSIECGCWQSPHTATEWQRNYDAARGFALDSQGNPLADMTQSELIQQPFVEGSKAHAGIKQYSFSDPEFDAIVSWLDETAVWNGGDGDMACETRN